ncbi:epidermal growth factor-like protein 8 [Bombina bombina]|uniref:epidermal growth factor-like protein 8 n=1 Tax=Bombina bombina TaxID=8345 RepID=UPI00235B2F4C|nr:epidermal growth factor-like protein 8 [Bombina bombina]XP_053545136.1 epidermal growth factor-like protein 8 [Bombina bombina]
MSSWTLVVLIISVISQSTGQMENRGVCSRQVEKIPVIYNETFVQPKYQPYLTTCEGQRTCSRYKTVYTVSTRQVRREISRVTSICCPGWKKKDPNSEACEEAVCYKPCQNGGTCIKPNMCRCSTGWGGRYCHVDIDECRRPSHPCSQLCINTRGSFRCDCRPGFTLSEDGKTCKEKKKLPPILSQQAEDASRRLSNEVQDLRLLVTNLEQRLDNTLSALQRLFPVKLSEIRSDQVLEFWERIQSLDRVDSLSDQLMYMEEKMGECSCRSNEIEMAVNLKR